MLGRYIDQSSVNGLLHILDCVPYPSRAWCFPGCGATEHRDLLNCCQKLWGQADGGIDNFITRLVFRQEDNFMIVLPRDREDCVRSDVHSVRKTTTHDLRYEVREAFHLLIPQPLVFRIDDLFELTMRYTPRTRPTRICSHRTVCPAALSMVRGESISARVVR